MPSTFFCETGSLTGLELAGQWAEVVFLPHQCWGYRHIPPHLAFYTYTGHQMQLMFRGKPFIDRVISRASLFFLILFYFPSSILFQDKIKSTQWPKGDIPGNKSKNETMILALQKVLWSKFTIKWSQYGLCTSAYCNWAFFCVVCACMCAEHALSPWHKIFHWTWSSLFCS